jgi:CRISPR-associated protein (TIGR03984 family)
MKRTIHETLSSQREISLPAPDTDLHAWLTEQAQQYQLPWLLAYADDGVIWGELRDDGHLHLSCAAFPQSALHLRWITLQQCRLFGPPGELLLWPGPQGRQARLRLDSHGETITYIDEEQLLWGHSVNGQQNGFMLLVEGAQGISHAPPITTRPGPHKRARLHIRHYLHPDTDTGIVRIGSSRLVALIEPQGGSA